MPEVSTAEEMVESPAEVGVHLLVSKVEEKEAKEEREGPREA